MKKLNAVFTLKIFLIVCLQAVLGDISFSQFCTPYQSIESNIGSIESQLKNEKMENIRFYFDNSKELLPRVKKECPDKDTKELETKLNDLWKKYQERRLAEIKPGTFTSDFHKKNVFQIVFSKYPLTIKKEDPSKIANKFSSNDFIYGLQYFGGTFSELTNTFNYAYTRIFVDGRKVAEHHYKLSGEKTNWTYLDLEVLPDPKNASTQGAKKYAEALSKLSPGVYKVRVETINEYNSILAEGEFEFDCSSGTSKMKDISNGLNDKATANVFMPKPSMNNPKLEKEMLEAMKKSGWKETPLRVVITQNDWEIKRNALGAVERRVIAACLAVKTTEGKCKLFYITFSQEYSGKKFGKTEFYGTGASSPKDIPCENINK